MQKLARHFVCVADEAFFLGPPNWFKTEWLPNKASTNLFQKYKNSAPRGVIPNGSTVQGVYCMTAEGDFLSGFFAWAFPEKAKRVIEQGWTRFEKLAQQKGWKPKPVPTTPLDKTLGKPLARGAVKLQVAVRDLPRAEIKRPGSQEWERCAFNLKWFDLTPSEAKSFVTSETTPQSIPKALLQRLSMTMLKDCARGQCDDWPKGSMRDGKVTAQCIKKDGDKLTMRLSGFVILSASNRWYAPELFGEVEYDTKKKEFVRFEMMASGQRKGRTQFNFRQDDLGPAPLGVAFKLHKEKP